MPHAAPQAPGQLSDARAAAAAEAGGRAEAEAVGTLERSPLQALAAFVENRGQGPEELLAYTYVQGGVAGVLRDGRLSYALDGPEGEGEIRLVERLSRGSLRPRLRETAPTRVSYFVGRVRLGGLPTYRVVDLGEVAPGIRGELLARPGNVEKRFHLAPGSEPEALRIVVEGARELRRAADGGLELATAAGTVRFTPPVAWQPRPDGGRDPVAVAYRVEGAGYGFELGPYDPSREVVIDPLLGGALLRSFTTEPKAIATDPWGRVFVAGMTRDANLAQLFALHPGAGGAVPASPDDISAFVARFSRDLQQLEAIAFFNGTVPSPGWGPNPSSLPSWTVATALAIFPGWASGVGVAGGDVVIAGFTNTADLLGSTPLAGKSTNALARAAGRWEVFVIRLNNDLDSIQARAFVSGSEDDTDGELGPPEDPTTFGGGAVDLALQLDTDPPIIWLAFNSKSTDLPTRASPPVYRNIHPRTKAGERACYLAKLDAALSDIEATWLGKPPGATDPSAWSFLCTQVAWSRLGSIFVAGAGRGELESAIQVPPIAHGGLRRSSGPQGGAANPYPSADREWDALVLRVAPDLTQVRDGNFLGGRGTGNDGTDWGLDGVLALEVMDNDELLIGGLTDSADFPYGGSTPSSGPALSPWQDQLPQGLVGNDGHVGFLARLDQALLVQAWTYVHACPVGGAGQPDCTQGGDGEITAVGWLSQGTPPQRTLYALYHHGVFGQGFGSRRLASYHYLPRPSLLPPLVAAESDHSLLALSEGLSGLLNATELDVVRGGRLHPWPAFSSGSIGTRWGGGALSVTAGYTDPATVQPVDAPRVLAAFDLSHVGAEPASFRHPGGFAGPDTDGSGNQLSDQGLFVIALDPRLSAGTQPTLVFDPDAGASGGLFLGAVPPNHTATRRVRIQNQGPWPVTLFYPELSEPVDPSNPGEFSITPNPASCWPNTLQALVLAPGASCDLPVRATNTAGRTDGRYFELRLLVVANDPNGAVLRGPELRYQASPLAFHYAGSTAGVADYAGTGLDFGTVDVGQGRLRSVEAESFRNGATIAEVRLEGQDKAHFHLLSDGCSGGTWNMGQRCTVELRYSPTAAGSHDDAWLTFRVEGLGPPPYNTALVQLRLRGAATAPPTPPGGTGSPPPSGGGGAGSGGGGGGAGGGGSGGGSGGGGGGALTPWGLLPLAGALLLTGAWRRRAPR